MGGQEQKLGWAWALVGGGSPEEPLAGAVAARTAAIEGAGEAPTGERGTACGQYCFLRFLGDLHLHLWWGCVMLLGLSAARWG